MDNISGVGVLDKAVSVLAAVESGPATLAQLVAATGLARPTTHRIAVALEHHRLLARDVQGRFILGPRVAELVSWVTIPEPGPGQDRASVKEEYLRGLRNAPRDAILVKLADRASNAQTLQNLPLPRQRAYYAQTVEHIVPLAAGEPWFAGWYASWAAAFAPLAEPGPGGPAARLSREIPSQVSKPSG